MFSFLTFSCWSGRRFFPRVEVFYAVKCNPDPYLVQSLNVLGCNFDCASQGEIALVKKYTAEHNRQPEIVYANPCKAPSHIRYALSQGVTLMTFDNVAEVEKCARIQKLWDNQPQQSTTATSKTRLQLILRIVTDDRGAQCRLSSKYGAPRHQWRPLLAAAMQHGIPVVGVSFHVGSGCRDASRYEAALNDAREVFDMAKQDFGMDMHLLDIGGGYVMS